jgi:hypothetical protein
MSLYGAGRDIPNTYQTVPEGFVEDRRLWPSCGERASMVSWISWTLPRWRLTTGVYRRMFVSRCCGIRQGPSSRSGKRGDVDAR